MKRSAKSPAPKKKPKSQEGQRALSIRQPWAWLIVNGYNDIENRVWATKVRGRILIHAGAKPVTQAAYDCFLEVCRERRIKDFPDRKGFDLGGIIVGSAELVDCVDTSRSFWFDGPYGSIAI